MYQTLRKIHLWLSVPFGIVLAVVCLTGLILLFEPPHAPGEPRQEFFLDMMRLHRWLFDAPPEKGAMTAGKMVVGISTCAMVVILLSGILLWWMRARRSLRHNLSLSFREGFHGFCMSLHSAGGIYVALFLLAIALTGLTWSFGWYREGFNALFGIPKGSHIVYEIHAGKFGGVLTQIIWAIAVCLGTLLPLSGYYLWISRLSRRKKAKN